MADPHQIEVQNLRAQPVQLYCLDRVLNIAPHGKAKLTRAEAAAPQVKALHRQRLIRLRPLRRPINVNLATQAELETLSGVGPATAKAILDHRVQHGKFVRIQDLLEVADIGPATFKKFADQITVHSRIH